MPLLPQGARHWPDRPAHPRLTYLTASSTDPQVVAQVAERAAGAGPVLVVLDSDHGRDHVLAELRAYAPMVTPAATWWWRTATRSATTSRSTAPGRSSCSASIPAAGCGR
jgi:hypothetical protein